MVRRRGGRRRLEDHERRHHLAVRLQWTGIGDRRRPRRRPLRQQHPLGRHWGEEQPALPVLGRRRLQIHRRRQGLDEDGPRRLARHRPHRGAPHRSRYRLRRRPRPPLGPEQRARRLQDHRRRQDVDARAVRGRHHRIRRPRDGTRHPLHAVRRGVAPAALGRQPYGRGGPGQRTLQDQRRRQDVEASHRSRVEERPPDRSHRPHRHRNLGAEPQARVRVHSGGSRHHRGSAGTLRGRVPLRRRRRDVDPGQRPAGDPALLLRRDLGGPRRQPARVRQFLIAAREQGWRPHLCPRVAIARARRPSRPVVRSARRGAPHPRQRRRSVRDLRRGPGVVAHADSDRPVLRRDRGQLARALPDLRRAPGQRRVVRPQRHAG